MLRKLTVKNYKGFKEETIFDLTNIKNILLMNIQLRMTQLKTRLFMEKTERVKVILV